VRYVASQVAAGRVTAVAFDNANKLLALARCDVGEPAETCRHARIEWQALDEPRDGLPPPIAIEHGRVSDLAFGPGGGQDAEPPPVFQDIAGKVE